MAETMTETLTQSMAETKIDVGTTPQVDHKENKADSAVEVAQDTTASPTQTQTQTQTTESTPGELPSAPAATVGSMGTITPPRSIIDDLTAEEKFKLQQAWVHLVRMCGNVNLPSTGAVASTPDRTNQLLSQLDGKSRDTFKTSIWSYILAEQPDALVVRFLRARKWDVDAAMDMLISAVNWRDQKGMNQNIIFQGDGVALKEEKDQTKDDKAFLMQYRSGKSFVRGHDKENRPIYIIRVRLHDPNAQTSECMEAYTLHNIESIAVMATYPSDKACLIFDMTGFGLKNMDFHVVKFLCQVFEARYPETLGLVLIHNAPFVFWGTC
jgi:hypothetical protein